MTNEEIIQRIIWANGKCGPLRGFTCEDCPLYGCEPGGILEDAKQWKQDHIELWNTETKTINGIKYRLEPITEFQVGCDYVWVGAKVRPYWWRERGLMDFVLSGDVFRCVSKNGKTANFKGVERLGYSGWHWGSGIENFRKATAVGPNTIHDRGELIVYDVYKESKPQKLSDKIDKVRFE